MDVRRSFTLPPSKTILPNRLQRQVLVVKYFLLRHGARRRLRRRVHDPDPA
jgi:hypothetical protein